jgi:hypothetical protein
VNVPQGIVGLLPEFGHSLNPMVHLRATKKVLDRLKIQPAEGPPAKNALGDWYANRVVWDRQPILVLMSSASRLLIFEPARDVSKLPERLAEMVRTRLLMIGIPAERVELELNQMGDVIVARTNDRSALSGMNQLTQDAGHIFHSGNFEGQMLLPELQAHMEGHLTSMKGRGYIKPGEEARALLMAGHFELNRKPQDL